MKRRQLLRLGALAPLAPKVIAALPLERMPAPYTTLRLREPMTVITFTFVGTWLAESHKAGHVRVWKKGDPIE